MPRLTQAGPEAAADVAAPISAWKRRIEAFPSALTRLAVVSGMRDMDTGQYADQVLARILGDAGTDAVIRRLHEECHIISTAPDVAPVYSRAMR